MLWGWLRQEFLSNFYNHPWYNGIKNKEDAYVENKMSVMIGMPWLRQLRIRKSKLSPTDDFFNSPEYLFDKMVSDCPITLLLL